MSISAGRVSSRAGTDDQLAPRTSVVPKTLAPRWPPRETVTLELPPRACVHPGLHALLVCVDEDKLSKDDVIGACALPIGRWLRDTGAPLAGAVGSVKFDEPLLCNGRECGRLRGELELVPPDEHPETPATPTSASPSKRATRSWW